MSPRPLPSKRSAKHASSSSSRSKSAPASHQRTPRVRGALPRKPNIRFTPDHELAIANSREAKQGEANVLSDFVSGVIANPTGTMKELKVTATDFFDYEATENFVLQYHFDVVTNNLFPPFSGDPGTAVASTTKNVLRVDTVDFYCLPRFRSSMGISDSALMVLFSVPCLGASASSTSQQTTVVTPTAIADWTHIGSFNASTFKDAILKPQYRDGALCAGCFAVCNPDDGTTLPPLSSSPAKIQFMAVITFANPLPALPTINVGIGQFGNSESVSENPWTNPFPISTKPTPAIVTFKGIANSL